MPRVLIADDEEGIRFVIKLTLEAGDHEIFEAADGLAALEAARAHEPDVILLDAMMPRRSGFEVCRELKSDPGTAGIRIVICTASASTDDRRRAFDAGADDVLIKPFSTDGLERAIRGPS